MNLGARFLLCLGLAGSLSAASVGQSERPHPGDPSFVPLTAEQRRDRFFKQYLGSPFTYIAAAGAASGGQIGNDPKEWNRTWDDYGKRFGTTLAMFTIDEAVHEAGDAALGLDPRFFPCRCKGALRRTWNAFQMSFLAYNDRGDKRIDFPRLAGAYGSGMIVTTWYPAQYDPLVQGVQMGHANVGLAVGVNAIREFAPELKRFFGKFRPH